MSEVTTDQRAPTPLTETPNIDGAYPRLAGDQIATLEAGGTRRTVDAGETLVRDGERSNKFFVILTGKVAVITTDDAGNRQVIRVHGPGRFLGELGDLEDEAAFYTAEVVEPGEVLEVPTERVRALVAHDPVLSDVILRAYLSRRSLLIQEGTGFRIIGSCFDPDTVRLREFASRNRLPHKWIDLERDKYAERLLQRFAVSPQDTPVVIWAGEVLRNPTNTELARRVGLPVPDAVPDEADVVVVGAGPAGLAAAVYGSSDGLITATMERIATGGQAGTSSRIENYLGFPGGISGADLAERASLQAAKFGARIMVSADVVRLDSDGGHHLIRLADQASVIARAVVLAVGARYRKLAVPGIESLEGNGVYYAATFQEALMCGTGPVVIVGGGNSAGQAAVFLAARVSRVYVVIRGDDLNISMSRRPDSPAPPRDRAVVHRDPGSARKRWAHGGGDRGQTDRRASFDPNPRPVRFHRRRSQHLVARRRHRARRPRLRTDRPGRALLEPRRQSAANATSPDDAGDQPTRCVRGG
jgi:thioredoxin reductase (NADPH)